MVLTDDVTGVYVAMDVYGRCVEISITDNYSGKEIFFYISVVLFTSVKAITNWNELEYV